MYNINIMEIVEKNKQYNEMIDFLLDEYNLKFNEYKQKISGISQKLCYSISYKYDYFTR